MTALSIQPTFPIFTDIDGQPLEDGYVFIGTANLNPITNPITVYWDAALTLTAVQPIRTLGGYPMNSGTPARLYVNSDYSIQVQNKNGSVVYSAPAATERLSGVVIEVDATDVSFIQAGTGAVTRTAQAKMRDVVSVKDFGATGDGVTDDTVAIQSAITASANKELTFPSGTYLVTAMLSVINPMTISGPSAIISFHFPVGTSTANGALFDVKASDVEFDSLTIDATGVTGTITGANRYAIRVDPSGATRYSNISVMNCRFTNLTQYSGTIPATLTVMHAILVRQVDDLRVQNCVFNTISGACVFLVDTERAKIVGNDCIKFGWSGIWLNNANLYWEISGNTFSGTTAANPSYWGGAIDVMGQTSDGALPGEPDQYGVITNNRFDRGVYRYGSVLRLASSRNVVVSDNVFNQCQADQDATPGAGGIGSNNEIVTVIVRDVTINNGPHKNITIANNTFIAIGTGYQRAICARTSSISPAVNTTPCEGLIVDGNQFVCPDSSNYFQQCVVVHGLAAGYKDVVITNNIIKGVPYATPNYIIGGIPGLIAVLTNSVAIVDGVIIENNSLEYFNGSGTTNNDVGINIYDAVTKTVIQNNVFKNFGRAVLLQSGNNGDVVLPVNNVFTKPAGAGPSIAWRGQNVTPIYSAPIFVIKSSGTSITSSTTLANDAELKFPIGPNEHWQAQFLLDVGAALGTTGMKIAITTPTGAAQDIRFSLIPDTIAAGNEVAKFVNTSGLEMNWNTAKQVNVLNAQAIGNVVVTNGATAGMVTLQYAQGVSSATALDVRAGSSLIATRVA